MNKRLSITVLASALVFAGCDAKEPQAEPLKDNEAARFGGAAVVGSVAQVQDLNPLTTVDMMANQIHQFVLFTPLISYDENLRPVPRWARAWELSPDSAYLRFRLRPDMRWHDGVQATAHDVKFSYDLARHPESGFPNPEAWESYGEAVVEDSFTIRFALRPHAEYLDVWRFFTPVPQHVLQGVEPGKLAQHEFSRTPIGNGPFRLEPRDGEGELRFTANPDFPEELGGRPYLDRLIVRSIPDPTALATELITGRVHYAVAPPREQAEVIEQSRSARVVRFPSRVFVFVAWNHRRAPLGDVRVRRAFAYAVNRENIVKGLLGGDAVVAQATVPPMFWQYDPEAGSEIRHRPEEAKKLLEAAGFRDLDGDGFREDSLGRPLRLTLKTNAGSQVRADVMQMIQADLRKVGVDAKTQVLEFNTLVEQVTAEARDFDAVVFGYSTEFKLDDKGIFHCDMRSGPFHFTGYCNPEVDRLLEKLPLVTDRDEARPLWSKYQKTIAQEQPILPLYFQQRSEGVHASLSGVDPDVRGDLVGVSRWYLSRPGAEAAKRAK